jgi:hypothetical protein
MIDPAVSRLTEKNCRAARLAAQAVQAEDTEAAQAAVRRGDGQPRPLLTRPAQPPDRR